jgi:hydroxymethylpyrimidine pyrophosphatase-like HAD family hydrolase
MSLIGTVANYGGRQPDNTQNTKQFVVGANGGAIWVYQKDYTITPSQYQTPIDSKTPLVIKNDLYITKDLYVSGSIYNPSDRILKDDIEPISEIKYNGLANLEPAEFIYKSNPSKKHYGFIAQDLEKIYPELVNNSDMGYKTINYVELIPLLVSKINAMQKEIDQLSIHLFPPLEKVEPNLFNL